METFSEAREPLPFPGFAEEKSRTLAGFSLETVEPPLRGIIEIMNRLPYCFSLQCCYGHFVHDMQKDPHSLDPLPLADNINRVEYRISYVAFCLDGGKQSLDLMADMRGLVESDPGFIQFGSPTWFWDQRVNSYAIQVEPHRHRHLDKVMLDYREAVEVQKVRDSFIPRLDSLIQAL